MIFTDILMPDQTKMYFLLDEEASAGVILAELLELCRDRAEEDKGSRMDADSGEAVLCEAHSGRVLRVGRTLKEQGIGDGVRLSIERRSGIGHEGGTDVPA